MENKIILPKSFYETQDQPDAAFVRRMHAIDPKLLVYWNRFRGRWVIDRFSCDYDGHNAHDACPRVNVKLVQTEEGDYHPLNDRVLDWLRKADTWNSNQNMDKLNSDLDAQRDAYAASRENDIRLHVREAIHDEHMHSDSSFRTVIPR